MCCVSLPFGTINPTRMEQFGFEKEILLAYAPYPKMEPRSLQALQNVLMKYPFHNRVDTLSCFFISDDNDNNTDQLEMSPNRILM